MSSEINKTRVGAFVLGGVALLVLAVISLVGRNLFSDDLTYVMYFDGSVSGLSVGAPVVFRGVPLGRVTRINLVTKADSVGVTIPVYVRIDGNSFMRQNTSDLTLRNDPEDIIHVMIQRGLRARLQLQSVITGQYRIELDFFPNTPASYQSANREMEIPTVPSPLDALQRTLSSLPLSEIVRKLSDILNRIDTFTASEDIPASLAAIRKTFEGTAEVVQDLKPLQQRLEQLVRTTDVQLPETVGAFQLAMNSIAAAAKQIEATVQSADGVVSRDSRTLRDLHTALKELSEAARSVRSLANMLERHPEVLLRGKGGNR